MGYPLGRYPLGRYPLSPRHVAQGIMLARGEARSREVIAAQCDLWKAGFVTTKNTEHLEASLEKTMGYTLVMTN